MWEILLAWGYISWVVMSHFLQANAERGEAGSSAESNRRPVSRVPIPYCSRVWLAQIQVH